MRNKKLKDYYEKLIKECDLKMIGFKTEMEKYSYRKTSRFYKDAQWSYFAEETRKKLIQDLIKEHCE